MVDEQSRVDPSASLGEIALEPGTFEHDVAVSDRYQLFSTELLRLSLFGIGAVGFIAEHLGVANWSTLAKQSVSLSLLFMSLSGSAALAHRYIGPDGLACHLEYLRLRKRGTPLDPGVARRARRERNWLFKHAGSVLLASACFLGMGFICVAAGFLFFLWHL